MVFSIFMGPNGFEFDNMFVYPTMLSKSTSEITVNSKRFMISIDYSVGLNQNEIHKIKINNTKVNENDTIILNVCNNVDNLLLYPNNITEGQCNICLKNVGTNITDTANVSVLVLT